MNEDPLKLFSYIFGVSSVAGLAALLRSKQKLTVRKAASAFLNSGMFGLGVAMVWGHLYGYQYPWFMVGTSLLAGLGGISLMDFAYQMACETAAVYVRRAAENLPQPRFDDAGRPKKGDAGAE